jgi:predicted PurR-regulated permease PerM
MPLTEFAKRVAIAAAIVLVVLGLAYFFRVVSEALLVLFAAILFAVMLDGLTRLLRFGVKLPRSLALTIVVLGVFICVGAILIAGSARVAGQAPELRHSLQQSSHRIEHRLRGLGVNSTKLTKGMSSKVDRLSALVSHVHGYLSTSFSMAADLLIVLVAGIYFAANPGFYTGAPIRLLPQRRRERMRAAFREVGHALRRWLIGRFASMLAVGLVTGVGLTLLNVQLAVLLAVIAALLTFIPYLGTIISLIPAVLVGLLTGPLTALYVLLLYLGAHALEGYVLSPLIQSRTVHLAPGWLILSQLVGALSAGVFGILIAAPLLVTLTILVQLLYIEDVLGDKVHVLGE